MKKSHIIGIIIIAIAIGAIMSTVADSGTYASFSVASSHPSKEFHVVGLLDKEKEQSYDPKKNPDIFSFYLKDNEGLIKKVVLNKPKPQDFERSEQIVIIGKMSGDEFHASNVLLKCPSKYNDTKEQMKRANS